MRSFSVYINLPVYLSQWLKHRLGDPVVFPPSSPQNAVIRTFLTKLPDGANPDIAKPGLTAIAIPDSAAKPVETYHYLTHRGKQAVAESCKDLFLRSLWTDITPLADTPVGLNTLIGAWCELNGIDVDRIETVRQCYYRIRKEYFKRGINLKNFTRKK